MKFIPGLELSQYFFEDALRPLLQEAFPGIDYAAARLGWGSDVLGFDTDMSMDHGWGPKITLFLEEADYAVYHEKMQEYFAYNLPFEVRGFPTHFGEPYEDGGVMAFKSTYPIHHMVTITTPERFFADYLGVDIQQPLTAQKWLTLPSQKLRTIRYGRIYHDGLGRLSEIRQRFHWYPHDLWIYILANQWQRIDQEEPFLGRTGSVSDELGSQLIAARLIRDIMNLVFLMEKEYAPYNKWFGTAFKKLALSEDLLPLFDAVLSSHHWQQREAIMSQVYLRLAEAHNSLGLTPEIQPCITNFHKRPFLVPHTSRFVNALLEAITDPEVLALPRQIGSINQIVDNTDVLENNAHCQSLQSLYQPPNSA